MLSLFETLPQEIRSQILESCCVSGREIIPFPNEYEIQCDDSRILDIISPDIYRPIIGSKVCEWNNAVTSLGDTRYKKDLSGMALLGVNKKLRYQASTILLEKNLWRLSRDNAWMGAKDHFWKQHAKLLRYAVAAFGGFDVTAKQLDIVNKFYIVPASRGQAAVNGLRDDPEGAAIKEKIHEERVQRMMFSCLQKVRLLEDADVKGLVIEIGNLLCPSGCCRKEMVRRMCHELEFLGDSYEWDLENYGSARIYTLYNKGFRITGFLNEEEKQIVRDTWTKTVN